MYKYSGFLYLYSVAGINRVLRTIALTESKVYHMEADKLNKGHIIYNDGSELKTVDSMSGSITLIAGEVTNH